MKVSAEGPYFDELKVGQEFAAPGYTLSEGRASAHQIIVGDRLRLPLDDPTALRVTGRSPLAHPAFVWDVAIGQSTVVTQHVKANLFPPTHLRVRSARENAPVDALVAGTPCHGFELSAASPGAL